MNFFICFFFILVGCVYVLNQFVEVEDLDEGVFFEQFFCYVDDVQLQKMVRWYEVDEKWYVLMFCDVVWCQGVSSGFVVFELYLMEYLNVVFDGFLDCLIIMYCYVMEVYVFLQVVEEWVIEEFIVLEFVFCVVDLELVDFVFEVVCDEECYFKYCYVIVCCYVESELECLLVVQYFWQVEVFVYVRFIAVNVVYVFKNGFVKVGLFECVGWRIFMELSF